MKTITVRLDDNTADMLKFICTNHNTNVQESITFMINNTSSALLIKLQEQGKLKK